MALISQVTPKQLTLRKRCPVCGVQSSVVVDTEKLLKFRSGTSAYHVWPDATPMFRELVVTGTHVSCWAELTGLGR